MKKYVITVDTGTTNTRTLLWNQNRRLVASATADVGGRNTSIDGNNNALKNAVHDCIYRLLELGNIGFENVGQIVASGMITSDMGLVEVPHVFAPVGKEDLAKQCRSYLIEEVCPLPILFIPGVKNKITGMGLDNFESMDIMRGEEVESVAILDKLPKGEPYLLVLPGSHTKFVSVDVQGRITGCLTTMTGELLSCITKETIIADSVGRQFVNEEDYDREMVLKGFETADKTGMGRAAFAARILNTFVEKDKKKLANYILGVTLASDVQSLHNSTALAIDPDATVIVSGKNPLRQALIDVLEFDGTFTEIKEYIPDERFPLSAAGAYLIADIREAFNESSLEIY